MYVVKTKIVHRLHKYFFLNYDLIFQGKQTLGVEPTVGLGSALIIFLLVGVFAAGIAQAFQLVSITVIFESFTVFSLL